MKRISILGSTGSIGRSALAVIDAHPSRLKVVGLAAGANDEMLAEQIVRYRPRIAALASNEAFSRLKQRVSTCDVALAGGAGALEAVATHPDADIVLCASSGTDGLGAVIAAIEARKTIALANKEVLVMAGGIVMGLAKQRGVAILPVDSEHNAVHQCLVGRNEAEVKRIVLTASGGPFRGRSRAMLADVSADDALRHPTWRMGRKITIDSATLMNKGLEVIEAHWLFGVGAEQVDVVIHPQSVVHSMIELLDGSVIAQLGQTDMRLPIQYAFSYPERWTGPLPSLNLARAGRLEFEPPDMDVFPCLALAYRALADGPSVPIVLNAANEIAVGLFLDGRLGFTAIAEVIKGTMDAHRPVDVHTLADVREVDRAAREYSRQVARGLESKTGLRSRD